MYLFRIHIRPQGGSASVQTIFNYCLSNDLLGVGWQTNTKKNTKNWDEYFGEASQIHSNLQSCKYIHKWVSEGDLVWTRDGEANYYLARVISGWEYWRSAEGAELDVDIANIFRCELRRVELDAVPGKVVACFRPTRAIQSIADDRVMEYSKFLWSDLSQKAVYDIDRSQFPDIFSMLDAEETEDLVFLYLQSLGWYVVPNSRKADTMRFEFMLVDPKTNKKAATQVKTGDEILNSNTYCQHPFEKVFLFQSNEYYEGPEYDNIVCISRAELETFLDSAKAWFPASFQKKLDLVRR